MSVKKKISVKIISLCLLLTMLLVFSGCMKKEKDELLIRSSGSSALLPLLKAGQDEFYKKQENIVINLTAGGSYTGQNQVANGTVDIGNSDVPLQKSLQDKGLVEHLIVGIPFIFIVNKDVEINSLTEEEYHDIFAGKITNWQDVGGKNQKITIIGRASSSGARATIKSLILKESRFTDNQVILDSNGALRAAVSTTSGAIGYVDAAYEDDSIKVLAYNGVQYSLDSVYKGEYPIYTFGRMYTKGEPENNVKLFIDYIQSDEFQTKYVEKMSFFDIKKLIK